MRKLTTYIRGDVTLEAFERMTLCSRVFAEIQDYAGEHSVIMGVFRYDETGHVEWSMSRTYTCVTPNGVVDAPMSYYISGTRILKFYAEIDIVPPPVVFSFIPIDVYYHNLHSFSR